MAPATTLVSSGRSTTVLDEHPGASPVHAPRAARSQIALPIIPFYILPYFFYLSQSGARSPDSKQAAGCNACPYCWRQPKPPDHRFCSDACRLSSARSAPELKYLPPHHASSVKITTRFKDHWGTAPLPRILAVYMITWTEASERAFQRYRDGVEARGHFRRLGCSPGNEQIRFRGTTRACTLGEHGNISPCRHDACWTCETIRVGFRPHLERKRQVPLDGGGIRLGAGIYTSSVSSKADQYAVNVYDAGSTVHAVLVCRVVIGRPYKVNQEDPTMRRPPPGFDCVLGKSGWGSAFKDDEYVVYDADAIRAAYLVLYDQGRRTT